MMGLYMWVFWINFDPKTRTLSVVPVPVLGVLFGLPMLLLRVRLGAPSKGCAR